MNGFRKDLEESERTVSDCGPEQTAALDESERTVSDRDPEQTAALNESERTVSDRDPEQTAALDEPERDGSGNDPERTAPVNGMGGGESVNSPAPAGRDTEIFLFDGMEFRTLSELAIYFQSYADISRRELSRKVRELYAGKGHLIPEFEAWLIAIGKEKELNAWKKKFHG